MLRGAAAILLGYLLFLCAMPAHADAPVLNDDEQAEVNLAIERGKNFLKQTQNPDGSWSGPKGDHPVGYTAIAGLALVECGVPLKDPAIQRAVQYVGTHVDKLDHTYQLSLAILFLDAFAQEDNKFGQSCQELIRGLGMRLVAGQTQSGGWGYHCPVLEVAVHRAMFKILTEKNEAYPLAVVPQKPDPKKKTPPPSTKKKGPTQIPPALYQYAVFTSPGQLAWMDTKEKNTCNSNTQFAILGLWTARKHGVPVGPSFNLVVNRFRRSQSPSDGGWAYNFVNGGGNSTPAMTCCGLIGLAVGYALGIDVADANNKGGPIKDPGAVAGVGGRPKPGAADEGKEGWRHYAGKGCRRYADVVDPDATDKAENAADGTSMIKGFGYVARSVGKPAGKMKDLPMQSLYFLWSLERVSVLYNLSTIGDRDWYRWGAEILVANQAGTGAWEKDGGYPGHTPILNTCFALLFLKRANLALDLTKKLPFEGSMLAAEIRNSAPPPPPLDPPKQPVAVVPTPPPPTPAPPTPLPVKNTPPPTSETPPVVEKTKTDDGTGKLWLGFGIAVAAFVLLAGAGIIAFLMLGQKDGKKKKKKLRVREDDEDDDEEPARKKSQTNGNGDSMKKSRPKMPVNEESAPTRKKTRPKVQTDDDE
jgi:hypothetical protein